LLNRFRAETYQAIAEKISLNPILNSFQKTVHQFGIEEKLYDQFLKSMEMDLDLTSYDQSGINEYILGSAEVVGLMTLRVFCKGDDAMYQRLKPFAMKLGSAFQKINFQALIFLILMKMPSAPLKKILQLTLQKDTKELNNCHAAHDWVCMLLISITSRYSKK
jgi:hypothetical protein